MLPISRLLTIHLPCCLRDCQKTSYSNVQRYLQFYSLNGIIMGMLGKNLVILFRDCLPNPGASSSSSSSSPVTSSQWPSACQLTRDADLCLSCSVTHMHKSSQLPPTNSSRDGDEFQVYCNCNPTPVFAHSELAVFTIEFGDPVVIYNKAIYKGLVFDPDNSRSAFLINYMTAHLRT